LSPLHTPLVTMTTATQTDALSIVYGRKRIIDTLYQLDPEKYKELQALDIKNIAYENSNLICQLEYSSITLPRADVLKNFWKHRTRTPSFFDYKVWSQAMIRGPWQGTPIAKLSYQNNFASNVLTPVLGRSPYVLTDANGVQKIYFVDAEQNTCTCGSWAQLKEHEEQIRAEFELFTDIQFSPICKHLQWYTSMLMLHGIKAASASTQLRVHDHICVYYFDHKRGILQYRITYDGVKSNGQWFPVDSWKEQQIYDATGNATGACWQMMISASTHEPPFQLTPYSSKLASLMQSSRAKN